MDGQARARYECPALKFRAVNAERPTNGLCDSERSRHSFRRTNLAAHIRRGPGPCRTATCSLNPGAPIAFEEAAYRHDSKVRRAGARSVRSRARHEDLAEVAERLPTFEAGPNQRRLDVALSGFGFPEDGHKISCSPRTVDGTTTSTPAGYGARTGDARRQAGDRPSGRGHRCGFSRAGCFGPCLGHKHCCRPADRKRPAAQG